jgi:hypothetical protein
MTSAVTHDLTPDHAENGDGPVVGRDMADITPDKPDARSLDPTQGRSIGSKPHDDPTQGRQIGSHPHDDPTRARQRLTA